MALAQTAPDLEVQVYAGLTITGAIETIYSIEYVTDLAEPAENDWRCLEFLQLLASPYPWTDTSAPATGKRFYRAVAMEAPANMVFIPPGTFRMGSPEDEANRGFREGPQTAVTISRGFWMGKYEVTQGEYEAVMGHNPSYFNGVLDVPEPGAKYSNPNLPVESVGWIDAVAYCEELTKREREAGRIPAGSVYRLPTEAEWEYACRAWTSTPFSYGDDDRSYTKLTDYAWCPINAGGTTHQVGEKLPNPWGLYDMHGNVAEWCQDWFAAYPGGAVIDPQGPAKPPEDTYPVHVHRGGGWRYRLGNLGTFCRSASRGYYPESWVNVFGFRVVLAPVQR